MSVEIPFLLQESFSNDPMGVKCIRFAQDLFALPDDLFPLAPRPAARLLSFEDDSTGVQHMLRWHQTGILSLGDIQKNGVGRRELVVIKLTQMYFIQKKISYLEVHRKLSEVLAGSGLEDLIGQLKPESARSMGRTTVIEPYEDEDGFWWVDTHSVPKSHRVV